MFAPSRFDQTDLILPRIFNPAVPSERAELFELRERGRVNFVDRIEMQVRDLLKAKSAGKPLSAEELDKRVKSFFETRDKFSYGNWVYYPWKNIVVHLLGEEDFIEVRTQRNKYKITPEEQESLRKKKIGIIGLSVGQNVALTIALERGCGEMRIADFDTLELSNLNRIKAGVPDLGVEKTLIAAREISEIDPYLKLTIFREGVSEDNIEDFLMEGGKLDLLIDECDSLDVKVLARERARNHRIPVIMETSDRGMLDIERFDQEPLRPFFHGGLETVKYQDLKNLSDEKKVTIGLKITGAKTISTRMKASLLEIGQTITSWPQLASAVFLGGASVAHSSRKLLLGDNIKSGRYYVDLDEIVLTKKDEFEPASTNKRLSKKELVALTPKDQRASPYLLEEAELIHLIKVANLAPSGGNAQPWLWVFDKQGVLHLFHDKEKSHSLLDFKGTGSLIAFGAALENLRLESAKMGLEISIDFRIKEFDEDLIASIRFISKSDSPIQVPFGELADGIALRCTNRKNEERTELPQSALKALEEIAVQSEVFIESKITHEDLDHLSKVIGGMDRLRLFHEQGYQDFISEIRWTPIDAEKTKDGIDLETLEMGAGDKAAMGLIQDPGTIEFFRKYDLGVALTKISDKTLHSASAVMMIQADEFSPIAYLKSGIALQRIWIKANQLGISFQPISASLFLFHRVEREINHGFKPEEVKEIERLKIKLNELFNIDLSKKEIFMFRLTGSGEPSMRAFRRDVSESLIIQ